MVDKKTVDLPDFEDYDLIDNLEEAGQNGQTSGAAKPTAYTVSGSKNNFWTNS